MFWVNLQTRIEERSRQSDIKPIQRGSWKTDNSARLALTLQYQAVSRNESLLALTREKQDMPLTCHTLALTMALTIVVRGIQLSTNLQYVEEIAIKIYGIITLTQFRVLRTVKLVTTEVTGSFAMMGLILMILNFIRQSNLEERGIIGRIRKEVFRSLMTLSFDLYFFAIILL